jgi:hypothetical protein
VAVSTHTGSGDDDSAISTMIVKKPGTTMVQNAELTSADREGRFGYTGSRYRSKTDAPVSLIASAPVLTSS